MKTTPCKGCQKPIAWGTTAEGKRIPLDTRPPVYRVVVDIDSGEIVECVRDKECFVTHFATCPKANEF